MLDIPVKCRDDSFIGFQDIAYAKTLFIGLCRRCS